MMNKKVLQIAMLSISLFAVSESRAAFPVKAQAVQTATTDKSRTEITAGNSTGSEYTAPTAAEVSHKAVKKHSFFRRLAEKAAISQAAYIILSIFWLGWLAIGLNDDFEGVSWLLALLLYILFYFPGLIYSLIVMGDYY